MSEVHCLLSGELDADALVRARLGALIDEGLRPVLVTLRRPVEVWKQDLADAGIDSNRVFFVDATARELDGRRFLGNVLYVGGPVHLEAIAMRARMACRREPAHMILDSVEQVADAMGDDLAEVFSHALAHGLRHDHVPGTLIVQERRERLARAVQAVCDGPIAA